jgi:hypothetical protein
MKSKNKNFGLADSFVLHAARKIGGRVLTGDPDFRGVKDAIMLRRGCVYFTWNFFKF